MAYRVLIVDDFTMPRQVFEAAVRQSEQYTLAASLSSADEAVSYCRRNAVDLVLMDVVMVEGMSGMEASRQIKELLPKVKIIMVTSMPEVSYIRQAKAIGVDSFWYKDGQKDGLLDVMERTMAGEHIYPDETPLIRIGNATNHEFTERELDVLKELTTGDTNAEIAERLCISVATVKSHIQHLMEKTGFKTRTELVAESRGLGVVIKDAKQ